jgi:hypothetical protein
MRRLLWLIPLWSVAASAAPLTILGPAGLPGVDATWADGVLSFKKTGPERRLLALSLKPAAELATARSLVVRGSLSGAPAGSARLALVAFGTGGGAWYRLGAIVPTGEDVTARIALDGFKPTAFSAPGATFAWAAVERLWLGLTLDGPAEGRWRVASVEAASEDYHATAPLQVNLNQPAVWSLTADPAVKGKITCPPEGPGGAPAMRFDFNYPEKRHLYSLPMLPLPPDLEGYRAVRVRYKATLPAGPQLLLSLFKPNGAQYIIDPPVPASADWTVREFAISDFKLGAWSKDDTTKLELTPGMSFSLGCHGAPETPGDGSIWVSEVAFLP